MTGTESTRQTYIDRMLLIDDLELDLAGGCSACGLEPDMKCLACSRCNCDTHEACTRTPAGR